MKHQIEEISANDFALDVTEKAIKFMNSFEKYGYELAVELFEDKDFLKQYKEHIDTFNTEIFKVIQKLPIRIIGTLLHQMAIDKCLDPNCKIEISGREIIVFISEKGTIQ